MGDLDVHGGPAREEGVSAVTATPSTSLGERRVFNGEEYVYCYNAGGATASQTNGVKFVTGTSGYSVAATSLTDVFSPCVGVVKHADIAAASYGWVLIRGFASVVVVSALTADYKQIGLGAAGKFVEASGTTTLGTALGVGYAMGANTGAAGTVYAFIKTAV